MPLQDANKPSRRQILAAERKKHGAYDPVRLAKVLPPKRSFQRQSQRAPRAAFRPRLWKRDDYPAEGSDATPDSSINTATPASSGLSTLPTSTDKDSARSDTLPSSIPQINYGDAKPAPPVEPGAMHNDTQPSQPVDQKSAVNGTTASSGSDISVDAGGIHHTGHKIELAAGIVIMAVVVAMVGYFFKRYRHGLSLRFCGKESILKKRKKSQRLGSIDGLGTVWTDGHKHVEPCDDKTGSSDYLVSQVSSSRAGPFDRAISTMLSPASRTHTEPSPTGSAFQGVTLDAIKTSSYLGVPTPPKAALSHQRSLDSIAEVQEPPSRASSHFPTKRDSAYFDTTPKRLTWTDRQHRPMTSPGETGRSFGSTTPSSTAYFSTPESKLSKKSSPVRPQSAKSGGDIEMTRQGSKLVIRNRPSTATLRRPLSSAGSSFRSALRKTRGVDGEEEDGAICIETDGIVESPRDGVYDLSIPSVNVDGSQLRSHFSSGSSVVPQNRLSYATTASPAGSFSFEIKDAVRLRAPATLDAPAGGDGGETEAGRVGKGKGVGIGAGVSTESFVRDLDWDLGDCTLSSDSRWTSSTKTPQQQRQSDKTTNKGQ
ncbi:uncharacterized protein SPSC_02968 [Sporisorium scitamineum]|uniref:Uncharacterized protein n=1 Tax=Sporisorium scitamineum TaxID=49012 RepID=A0A0F7S358_9BASI|nr:uncharacterized protein SPSC_02968 [Sporisorium scitamineum]CDW97337.1 hypothetical protein [Sporisorium scitamineum]